MGPTGDERAINEAVGFVITFSIVLAAVTIVSSLGVGTLSEVQRAEMQSSVERAFAVIEQQFDDVANGGPARRSASFNLDAGSLLIRDQSNFKIRVTVPGPSTPDIERRFAPRSLQYEQDQTRIGYENGASFRADFSNSTVKGAPSMTCTDRTAILSFVRLNSSHTRKISGGSAIVSAERTNTSIVYPTNRSGTYVAGAATDVDLSVQNSPFKDAWTDHFDAHPAWDSVDDDTFRCEDVDRVFVRKTVLNVSFTR
jgi:hypothetical protein